MKATLLSLTLLAWCGVSQATTITATIGVSGVTADLKGLTCPSTTRCLAAGASGTVIRSNDGGKTWGTASSGITGTPSLNAVSCADSDHCVVVGDTQAIFFSSNGGDTWAAPTQMAANGNYVDVSCGTNYCVAGAGSGQIAKTTDGGATWSNITVASEAVQSLVCVGVKCLAILGNGSGDEHVDFSSDSGANWAEEVIAGATDQRGSKLFYNGDKAYYEDAQGRYVRGGPGDWTRLNFDLDEPYNANIANCSNSFNSTACFMGSKTGKLYYGEYKGYYWLEISPNVGQSINGIHVHKSGPVKMVFVGNGGTVGYLDSPFNFVWGGAYPADSVGFSSKGGDYDNDGDLDVLIGFSARYDSGEPNSLYRNDGNDTFTQVWTSPEEEDTRDVAWGDYDGDGDLDQLIGNEYTPSRIYRNDGNDAFTLAWSAPEAVKAVSVAWGDFDGDGDLDAVIGGGAGSMGTLPTKVFRNDGNDVFTLIWSCPELNDTASVIGMDYDGDSDLDLLIGNADAPIRVYRNDGHAAFTLAWSSAGGEPIFSIAPGDFDADGDLDFVAGSYGGTTKVYENNGDGSFDVMWSAPTIEDTQDVTTGDFDGDGDLDLLLAGDGFTLTDRANAVEIFRNDGGGVFTSLWLDSEIFLEPQSSFAGDFDGDGDLDFLNSNRFNGSTISRNYLNPVNTAPTAPALIAAQDGMVSSSMTPVKLVWTAATDAQTPAALITYNLRVGTTPGGGEIFSDKIPPGPGNVGHALSHTVYLTASEPATTYYWSVQAVDNTSYLHSTFPQEDSLQIRLDDQGPTMNGTVLDDGQYATTLTTLSASWPAFTDAINTVAEYSYSIGTTSGGADLVSWTSVGTALAFSRTNLTLAEGSTYYISVRAMDSLGNVGAMHTTDGIQVDTVGPVAGGAVVDDGQFTTSLTSLSGSWPAFTDPGSGVAEYSYSIGTTAGGTNVKDWTSNGTSLTFSLSNLTLSDSQQYFVNVRAKDGLGHLSDVNSSDGIRVDASAPVAGGPVVDGGSFATSLTTLTGSWPAFTDAGSGVAEYSYSIGTTVGGTNTKDWTSNGASLTINLSNLTLSDAQQYFINVRAKDGLGHLSSEASSDGIFVDVSGPTGGMVEDEGETTGSNTHLSASWSFTDATSGIANYEYSIGTESGLTNIRNWTSAGANAQVTATGLNLTDQAFYYINVRATDNAGNTGAVASSNGIQHIADAVDPQPGAVSDAGAYTSSATTLFFSWTNFTDNISVASYEYSIGLTALGTTIRDWTNVGNVAQFTATGLSLTPGTQYFVNLRAKDGGNNLSTPVSTDGITVDTAAPTGGEVTDEGATTNNGEQLVVTLTGFEDALSGIAEYSYSIGVSAGDDSIRAWTSAGANTTITATGLTLTDQQTYFINVKAKDNMDNVGTVVSSNGIQFIADATAPTAGTVTDEGAGTKETTQLSASWSGFSDASGIAEYSYSIGTSAGAINTKGWTSVGTDSQAVVTGLNLAFGSTYFFNVRAKDEFGNLSAIVSSNGILVETVGGDINEDGKIDIDDAKLANSFATGKATPTEAQLLFCDVSEPKDGKITTEDANLILRCAKGTIRGNPQYPWCPALTRSVSQGDMP